MANVPVDPGPPAALVTPLQVLAGDSVLFEAPLVKPGAGGYARNRRGYQAFETEEQAAAGDGRLVIGERTVEVIVDGATFAAAHTALNALDAPWARHVPALGARDRAARRHARHHCLAAVLTGGPLRVTITYCRGTPRTLPDATPVLGPPRCPGP